jgi:hypothetical protein
MMQDIESSCGFGTASFIASLGPRLAHHGQHGLNVPCDTSLQVVRQGVPPCALDAYPDQHVGSPVGAAEVANQTGIVIVIIPRQ